MAPNGSDSRVSPGGATKNNPKKGIKRMQEKPDMKKIARGNELRRQARIRMAARPRSFTGPGNPPDLGMGRLMHSGVPAKKRRMIREAMLHNAKTRRDKTNVR